MINYEEHHTRKFHLRHLPQIPEIQDFETSSKFASVVIPVFASLSIEEAKANITGYVAKAAAWALKTWKENSDAESLGVPCYIYVEDTIADVALPILFENAVPKQDVIVAPYDNTIWLSKCLQPVFDTSLSDYRYLIISDVDMFVVKSDSGMKLPIFRNLLNYQPTGFGCRVRHEPIPTYWMNHRKQALENVLTIETKAEMITEWCSLMQELTPYSHYKKSIDEGHIEVVPWAAVMVIAPDVFRDKVWLEKACKTFCDDESSIYAWTQLSESNQMWDIDEIDIDLFTDFLVFYNQYTLDTPISRPSLLHHYTSHDYRFMNIIGAV